MGADELIELSTHLLKACALLAERLLKGSVLGCLLVEHLLALLDVLLATTQALLKA